MTIEEPALLSLVYCSDDGIKWFPALYCGKNLKIEKGREYPYWGSTVSAPYFGESHTWKYVVPKEYFDCSAFFDNTKYSISNKYDKNY